MKTKTVRVPFSYLDRQFVDIDAYLQDVKQLVASGDFTLGKSLGEFEARFAELSKMPHAVGVGTGTDAIILSLKMLGIGAGDEVITTPMTFIATVGAIVATGATPKFVDSEDGFVIDASKIEAAITPKTKAILPVHYTGNIANMSTIAQLAKKHNLQIVEDACQSIQVSRDGKPVGSWGMSACFSLHPLKNLNVWGDGGVIVTRSSEMAHRLKLYRNHGLINRDEVASFGVNCRLDTLQAVIGNRLIDDVEFITNQRIENAKYYDQALASLAPNIRIPARVQGVKHVFHLYMIRAERRDDLLKYLVKNGVEAKIHYPIPAHLQQAAERLGHKKGDFPVCEHDCERIISLPAHQHLTREEMDYTIDQIMSFYKGNRT